MSQPFDPTLQNIESPEEVRIRRMLAYKSLIISILQRSCFFLLLIAFIIAAIVLFLLHRQGQKNFFRKRSSLDLIYDPKVSKNQGIAPISIMNVFQVLSTGAVKEDAGNTAQIPADKFGYLGRALEASLDRNTTNTLTLIVTWDDEKEIAQCGIRINDAIIPFCYNINFKLPVLIKLNILFQKV